MEDPERGMRMRAAGPSMGGIDRAAKARICGGA